MSDNLHAIVSASLRSRPVWEVLLPMFDSSNDLTFEASPDDTYDITFHFPSENCDFSLEAHTIIVTPPDIEEANRQATLIRTERFAATYNDDRRLYHQVIIFLNSAMTFQTANRDCTIDGFVSLQVLLFDSPSAAALPIIMVAEPVELLASIREHCQVLRRNLNQSPGLPYLRTSSPSSLRLLEHIVAHSSDQHTCQQNLNILSDLFPSLRALSVAIRTVEGHHLIADYLGDHVARNMVAFLGEERISG